MLTIWKNGFGFDLAADRKKAWDSILRDKLKFVIGSPPCTSFSRLQELNKHMYRNDAAWMAKFQEGIEQAKRYANINEKLGFLFYTNTHGERPVGSCRKLRKFRAMMMFSEYVQTCVNLV